MASKQKRRFDAEQALREWDNAVANFRSALAGRSAAEILYDDAVVGFLAIGLGIEKAVQLANGLYPGEALRVAPDTIAELEIHYTHLARISFMETVRETVSKIGVQTETQPQA